MIELKHVIPGILTSASAAVAGLGFVVTMGPYGLLKPMPPECLGGPACVLVVGLDDDVRYIPTGGDSMIDLDDNAAERIVDWSRDLNQPISVYRYPRPIDMPDAGFAGEEDKQVQALAEARAVGERFGAKLVIMGRARSDSVSLVYVDTRPKAEPKWKLTTYDIGSTSPPDAFKSDFLGALVKVGAIKEAPPEPEPATPPAAEAQAADAQLEEAAATAPEPTRPKSNIVQASANPPTPDQLRDAYPRRARSAGVAGSAEVKCVVTARGDMRDCEIVSATREDFAKAALKVAKQLKGRPKTKAGVPQDDGETRFTIAFKPDA